MAYIELKEMTIVVLNGFEAAALVNEYIHTHREYDDSELFQEHELDDAIEYGFGTWIVRPLSDDQFKYWSITPFNPTPASPMLYRKRYIVEQILNEDEPLYYVDINSSDQTIDKALSMFSERWLMERKYTLRFAYIDELAE